MPFVEALAGHQLTHEKDGLALLFYKECRDSILWPSPDPDSVHRIAVYRPLGTQKGPFCDLWPSLLLQCRECPPYLGEGLGRKPPERPAEIPTSPSVRKVFDPQPTPLLRLPRHDYII